MNVYYKDRATNLGHFWNGRFEKVQRQAATSLLGPGTNRAMLPERATKPLEIQQQIQLSLNAITKNT